MRTHRPTRIPVAAIVAIAALGLLPGDDRAMGGEKPYRMVILSTRSNSGPEDLAMLGPGRVVSGRGAILSRYATPNCRIPWSVRRQRMRGGKQDGVDVYWLDNSRLQIGVIGNRGMGVLYILEPEHNMRLGWDSPVQEVVNPMVMNLESRGGLGWLDGFNEWLCRCGMESMGQAGPDKFTNNMGDESTMMLTLHGKVANTPASEIEVIAEREPPFRVTIRGRVEERTFHGPKLVLETQISTEPGSNTFRIHDSITNVGSRAQEYQMLYHMNFGPPILEEGARFLAPLARVTPMNARAAQDVGRFDTFTAPRLGFVEQVYFLQPRYEGDHRTLALIHNKAGDRGASIRFRTDDLPCLTLWKNTAAVEDGYVTGIEPGTSYPNSRKVEREHGRVPKLEPGASHQMLLDVAVHTSAAEVQQVAAEIARIQGPARPIVDDKPEK